MNVEDALRTVNSILEPNYINDVQELIFRQCWAGKTYQDIATVSGYTHDHIRAVGSHLWKSLSEQLGEKTTKSNFRSVLRRYSQEQSGQTTASANQALSTPKTVLELPTGPVSVDSRFYIPREPIETYCYETVTQPGALIRIKAPRQMGKTSLMARILHHAQGQAYQTVVISMRQANLSLFKDSNRFLSWFCSHIAYRLGKPDRLKDHWDEIFGGNSNSTRYFEKYLLSELETPLVLAIDDTDIIFRYPEIATDFLGLLRSWYEKARYGVNNSALWQNLCLIIVHSTEVYVPLKTRQSPFNVGLSIDLPEFTPAQVNELASRYSLTTSSQMWQESSPNYISLLMEQVGGNPYFIRNTFHYLVQNNLALEQLFNSESVINDIHQELLRQKWHTLQPYPRLMRAYKEIVNSPHPIQLDSELRFELQSLGLIKVVDKGVLPCCQLLANYFRKYLSQTDL